MKKYRPGEKCLVMSRDEVRAIDAWAINELGIPGVVLMENAGRSCAELLAEKLSIVGRGLPRQTSSKTAMPQVCIFCGTGNNGGDGFVIARHLLNYRFNVIVVICGDRDKIKGDARTNLDILAKLNARIEQLDLSDTGNISNSVASLAEGADMIVDAIFGTGLAGQLRDEFIRLIENINALQCPILAVDIPSGLDCDTGLPLGAAIKADCTVTFVAVKKGFVTENARPYTGQIYVASIGVETDYFSSRS
jgi:NAD(P)H-hydrate epimerase